MIIRPWFSRSIRRILAACIVSSACALPPHSSRTVIGTRLEVGVERPFSSVGELRTAGLVNEAMVLVSNNRFFDAERSLRQAHYLEPQNEQIKFNLAVVLNQVGQPEEAHEILQALCSQRPEQPAYAVALADTLITQGRKGEARALLKTAFNRFKEAQNYPQAARIARSISNVSFELGYEEESLCYSYEAYTLAPSAEQLGWHGIVLVAENLYPTAASMIQAAFQENRAFAGSASAQHALALARFAQGDYEGALAAEETALDFISQSPMLGAEINAAWWLMKRQTLKEDESEDVLERLEGMKSEVHDFKETGGIAVTTWPPTLRSALEAVSVEDE
jgi:tetratricopeptide (TPR) repeat protein